ncbi:MAG: arginase family protein [Ignavibacteriae bacterium]|nr:arginase family protein [Ignavibacteriota bacterium]
MQTLGKSSNFLAIESAYSNLEKSSVAIVSAPYEHTVSYGGGAGKGPKAILDASAYVEFYDDEFNRELCFDIGIATIPIKAHFKKYPKMSVLHFDAHSDLRDTYEGTPYSHACFMSRVCEFMKPKSITQVGIRAQCKEEAEFIKKKGVNTFYASAIRRGLHGKNWQKSVIDSLSKDVYVTFDVDYFDPSIMPSTGTPEPDGFLYSETLDVFRELIKSGRRIIGFDIVELAPEKKVNHPDLTTARLLYKMLNYAFAKK